MTMKKPPKGTRKKRRWWLWMLAVLAIAAGAWAVYARSPMSDVPAQSPSPSAQAVATPAPTSRRDAREEAYQADIAALEQLANNEQLNADTRNEAASRLSRLIESHQAELGIEQALTQAGFQPCVVLMQNGALTVMVARESLSTTESASILALCAAHTDVGVENIRIMTEP